jgi:DNA-binding beta-propeller fold protein YncE
LCGNAQRLRYAAATDGVRGGNSGGPEDGIMPGKIDATAQQYPDADDPAQDKVTAVLDLPLGAAAGLPRQDFLLDFAHHGLARNPHGTKLCVAGTMSRYAAIVTRKPFKLQRTILVGRVPYRSGLERRRPVLRVSVAGEDRVSVISYKTPREIARIRVGNHPQRMRTGVMRRPDR